MAYLFYGGIALMAVTAIVAIGTGIVYHITGKRLNEQFDEEFGKRE